MALFCIVDILIPFPCLPQPLPTKINVEFWTLKTFFYVRRKTLILFFAAKTLALFATGGL